MISASKIAIRYGFVPLLILATIILIGWSFAPPIGLYDEGFSLTNAARLLHGEVPNRDYWTAYPPATAMTLAAAFRMFEPTLVVARAVNAAWSILLASSIYALLARRHSRLAAAAAVLLAVYWVTIGIHPSSPLIPALALCVFAAALLNVGIETGEIFRCVAAGLIGGAIVLFRQDFGLYFCLASFFAICSTALSKPTFQRDQKRCAVYFLSTLAVTSVVLMLALFHWVGWTNFYEQSIEFPAHGMRDYRHLPAPSLLGFLAPGAHRGDWLLAWMGPIFLLTSLPIIITGWSPERVNGLETPLFISLTSNAV